MSEVKIYAIEGQTPESIATIFSSEGVSDKKANGTGDSNHLPASGTFTGFTFQGEGEMRHCVLLSEPIGHCSLSNLQAQAVFDTELENVEFEESKRSDLKGKLFPKGTSKLNPQIPSSQILAVQMLVGKKFKASEQEGIIQSYLADAKKKPIWESELAKAKTRLTAKKFFRIELT